MRRAARTITRTATAIGIGLLVAAAIMVPLTQPQLIVGDPLPQVATRGYRDKPPPPKTLEVVRAADKPTAIDLGSDPAPVSVAPVEDPLVQSLASRLQQAVLAAGDTGLTAVHVMDADGRVVFDLGGTTPLIPASTAKLITAAAALVAYGPDHTFRTRVAATADLVDGVVDGDLVLIGGGDPTLVSATYIEQGISPDRPRTPIDLLADQLVATGVTRITGGVVGDPGFLQGDPLADGWPPRYLDALDATRIAGLTIDQGLAFAVEGNRVVARAADDPAAEAAAALTASLIARGVVIEGPPASALGMRAPTGTPLAEVQSPRLRVLLERVVQNSDNHIADTLFRTIGRRVEGSGSFTDGAALIERVLTGLQIDLSTTTLQDGSGLSRTSTIPPGLLTTLNYRMTNSSVGGVWQELMAVSGVSGTLRSRLTGSIAELRLRGKTGSLQDVRTLSGAVVGPDGRPLYFSVASNDLSGQQLVNARRLQDLVVLALAAELYGCTELPPDPDDPQPGPGELPPLPAHTCAR